MNGWLVALIIVLSLLGIISILRFGLRAEYIYGEYKIWFCINRIRIKIYSSTEEKRKKKKKKKKKSEKTADKKAEKPKEKKPGRDIAEILAMVRDMGGVAARLIKRIRIDVLRANITVGDSDAAKAAIAYGRLWAAVGSLHSLLDNIVTVKSFDVDIRLDFDTTKIDAEGVIHISFRNLHILAAIYGFVKALRDHKNLFKGSGGSPHKLTKNTIKKTAEEAVPGSDAAAG